LNKILLRYLTKTGPNLTVQTVCPLIYSLAGKCCLDGDLICTYTLSKYISDIYVDGLCIISAKLNFEKLSVVTYLLSIDARWRYWLDWLCKHGQSQIIWRF